MIPIQVTAGNWNDGTIIATSPVVVSGHSTPRRIILRDLDRRYQVVAQCWDVDSMSRGLCRIAVFADPEHFNKFNPGALAKAWAKFVERSNRLLAVQFHEETRKEHGL